MQLGQLEAFIEVARQGNITRSAEALYLTQPSVTDRIKALEDEVGDKLFKRVKHGVALTDAGKTYLPYVQRAMQNLADGKTAVNNLREAKQGNLRLGSSSFMSMYILPNLLRRFAMEFPGVFVAVRTGHTEDILDMVLREEVQIGLNLAIKHPDIETITLLEDELVLVAAPSHPFSNRATVTMEDVAREGVVAFDSTTSYYTWVNSIFVNAGLALKGRFEMDSVETAKRIVQEGLGISLLPRTSVENEISLGTLKTVPITDSPPMKRELLAIYLRAGGLGGIAQAFLKVARQIAPTFDGMAEALQATNPVR
ncbi:MAG: LysR family transcriptional regulator [Dehalococcoidales bacterium]|nr:LysR family transcriptional regulator [Dehalococcoidales bacterium]